MSTLLWIIHNLLEKQATKVQSHASQYVHISWNTQRPVVFQAEQEFQEVASDGLQIKCTLLNSSLLSHFVHWKQYCKLKEANTEG